MSLFKKIKKFFRKLYSFNKFSSNNNFSEKDQIYQEIEDLDKQITDWQNILSQESIWLAVATFSLWGLGNLPLLLLASHQLIGALILLIAFFYRIESMKGKRSQSFPKIINEKRVQIIFSKLNETEKASMLDLLDCIEGRIKGISAYKHNLIFTLCLCYYTFCFWVFGDTLIVSIYKRILESLS